MWNKGSLEIFSSNFKCLPGSLHPAQVTTFFHNKQIYIEVRKRGTEGGRKGNTEGERDIQRETNKREEGGRERGKGRCGGDRRERVGNGKQFEAALGYLVMLTGC